MSKQTHRLQMPDGTPYAVEVDIHLDAIVAELGRKALRNSTGKAIEMGGLITVRVTGDHQALRAHYRALRAQGRTTQVSERSIEHLDVLLISCSSDCTKQIDEAARLGHVYGPYPCGPREVDVLTYTATSGTCVHCGKPLKKGDREKLVSRINTRLAKERVGREAMRDGA